MVLNVNMMSFTIKKLFNNTIPLRESVVNQGIEKDGLKVVLGGQNWLLTQDHLKRPIRSITTTTKTLSPVKIMYFSLPKELSPQLPLL